MTQNKSNQKIKLWNSIIIILSILGLTVCIAVLFPQVRQMIMNFGEQIYHKKATTYQLWIRALLSYALGGICFILFFDYLALTKSGKKLVQKVRQEIKECLSEIDFRSFLKPLLLMSGVYLLGILTIIRANYSYLDDLGRAIDGSRRWYDWSRYVSEYLSIFIHGDTRLTDISPIPQLLAILILAVSSLILVYVIGNKKITAVRLLASIPLGLSPYFLECISFKFDSPYMALSILASVFPFLFIARKGAFIFSSVVSLLIMCMTYQAASGIYLMIVVILGFQYWNRREKTNKEILIFLGRAAFAFLLAMMIFKFFLMKPANFYATTATFPLSRIIPGALGNIKDYLFLIKSDFGVIWKAGIILVLLFFIIKSIYQSSQNKPLSFLVSILVVILSVVLSYGLYALLEIPSFLPRSLYGFGAFLAIICVYVVSDFKKIAVVTVLALNWCFFTFAFSYGNALADQMRYSEFRVTILLQDLSALYPNRNRDDMKFQLKNSIDFTPVVKNIAKRNPIIEKLVPMRLSAIYCFESLYYLEYFNFSYYKNANTEAHTGSENFIDFSVYNLPVVSDTYYQTIQSDGNRVLITLKH